MMATISNKPIKVKEIVFKFRRFRMFFHPDGYMIRTVDHLPGETGDLEASDWPPGWLDGKELELEFEKERPAHKKPWKRGA